MKALILAGGSGKRLSGSSSNHNKCMGRLTWLTEKALRHGRGLRLIGAILLGIALVAGLIVARPQVTTPRPQS